MEEGTIPQWGARFFEEIDHPYLKEPYAGEERPKMYRLIQGDRGYWARRERQDWADMPNLWGPYDD